MNVLLDQIRKKKAEPASVKKSFKNEYGAIDLASIMVGVIVIGMIGGVIAATVFAVIPWSQDNAAKHQLDSVTAAESAYMGLSSTNPPSLPVGFSANSYGNSDELKTAGLLTTGDRYCVSTLATSGKGYEAFSQSASGKVWSSTDKDSKPVIFTGTLPTDCQFITEGAAIVPTTPPVATYVDPTPTLTILTYRCDTTTTGSIPMMTNLIGTEKWSDNITRTYTGSTSAVTRSLTAGTTYKMTFDGTYDVFAGKATTEPWAACLLAMDHWGSNTGVKTAFGAFKGATKLTDVPAHIPSTLTTARGFFYDATIINDPDISNWDMSNITDITYMFMNASAFNQPLNDWNVSKVTRMEQTFAIWGGPLAPSAFNQPLDKWNTSNVTNMSYLFYGTKNFNQPLNSWDTSSATDMSFMFRFATAFNQPLNQWDTSKVTTMRYMFDSATKFDQDIHTWNTAALIYGQNFVSNTFTSAYMPPKTQKTP